MISSFHHLDDRRSNIGAGLQVAKGVDRDWLRFISGCYRVCSGRIFYFQCSVN